MPEPLSPSERPDRGGGDLIDPYRSLSILTSEPPWPRSHPASDAPGGPGEAEESSEKPIEAPVRNHLLQNYYTSELLLFVFLSSVH